MDFDAAVAQLDALVATLEREDDERALLLLELVDAVHRPGLAALVAGDRDHPHAEALLALYGLGDDDPQLQVEEALDAVRPYIESHGGEVQLLGVDGGEVHLRLGGACNGCAGSATTLRRGVEEALREGFPAFERLVAHEPETPAPPAGGLPMAAAGPGQGGLPMAAAGPGLDVVQIAPLRRPVFEAVGAAAELEPGALRIVRCGDAKVVLAHVDGEVYALRDGCAVDGLSLEGGRLTGSVIVCPWHNCAYDARSGARVDEPAAEGLAVLPVAVRDDELLVAVGVA